MKTSEGWEAYQKIKQEFSDKLLVPSSAKIEERENKYIIEYGPFKIEAPKEKVVLLEIDNFEVEKFTKYLKGRYNLRYCSVKKEIDLLEIRGKVENSP